MHTQPNGWLHLLADHAVTFAIFPISADRTLLRTTWLVDEDAEEGVDYDIANLTHVWRQTNEQDADLRARTPRSEQPRLPARSVRPHRVPGERTHQLVRRPGARSPHLMTSAPVRPALWREEIDQPLVCVGVRQETHDVMSFTLRADEPTMLRFDPGQYVTLTAEIDGELLSRCYTIASAPTRPDSLTSRSSAFQAALSRTGCTTTSGRHAAVGDGTARAVQHGAASRKEVSVPLGRQWDHPADVHGSHGGRSRLDQ